MVYFFRGIFAFSLFNFIPVVSWGGGVDMLPVWIGIMIISFILSFKKTCRKLFSYRLIKILFGFGVALFLIVESCIVINSTNTNIPKNCDYMIVLGAGLIRGDELSLALKARLDTAYTYLIENPDTKAILTGGQGPDELLTEAEAMKDYLVMRGIAPERLILEEQATDTVENLTYSFNMIDFTKDNLEIILVTNKFHILRSKMIAHELGQEVYGLGAPTQKYLIPTYYLREFFAVTAEFIF